MRKRSWLCVLGLVTSTAIASDWQIVVSGEKMQAFIDKNSLARAGKYKKAWLTYSFDGDQPGNAGSGFKSYRSSKALEYFDCEERTSASIQTAYYSAAFGTGDFLGSSVVKPQSAVFSEVIPDTVGETLLDYVCKPAFRQAQPLKK